MADYWLPTREILQPLIKKPRLTETRLTRPPFRFLQDIVIHCIESTGYPNGLFDKHFLAKAKKAKPEKRIFLERLIACVGITNDTAIAARPCKIMSGLDPEQTNILLQEFGKAAIRFRERKCDLASVIERVNNGEKAPKRRGRKASGRIHHGGKKYRRHSSPNAIQSDDNPTSNGVIHHTPFQHRSPRLAAAATATPTKSPPTFFNDSPPHPRKTLSHVRSSSRGETQTLSPHPSRSPRRRSFFDEDDDLSHPPPAGFRPGRATVGHGHGVYYMEQQRKRIHHRRKNAQTAPRLSQRKRRPSFQPVFDQLKHDDLIDYEIDSEVIHSPTNSPQLSSSPQVKSPINSRSAPGERSALEIDDIPLRSKHRFDQSRAGGGGGGGGGVGHMRSMSGNSSRLSGRQRGPESPRNYMHHSRHSSFNSEADYSFKPAKEDGPLPTSDIRDESPPPLQSHRPRHSHSRSQPTMPTSSLSKASTPLTTDENVESYILATQQALGRIISRPPLKTIILQKPPFRFLHDVVRNVIAETGYMKGVFTEEELDYKTIKKEVINRVNFIKKVIYCVTATLRPVAVSARNVIAGIDPEATNLLLQAIAEAASIKNLDMADVLKKFNAESLQSPTNKSSLLAADYAREKAHRRSQGGKSPGSSPESLNPSKRKSQTEQQQQQQQQLLHHQLQQQRQQDTLSPLPRAVANVAPKRMERSHLPIKKDPQIDDHDKFRDDYYDKSESSLPQTKMTRSHSLRSQIVRTQKSSHPQPQQPSSSSSSSARPQTSIQQSQRPQLSRPHSSRTHPTRSQSSRPATRRVRSHYFDDERERERPVGGTRATSSAHSRATRQTQFYAHQTPFAHPPVRSYAFLPTHFAARGAGFDDRT